MVLLLASIFAINAPYSHQQQALLSARNLKKALQHFSMLKISSVNHSFISFSYLTY
jgi:hypothetical protein